MTDINDSITNATLAEMLPVGMLANGGIITLAMSAVANRKRNMPGWEAFHYERVSDAEFEITGGATLLVGGIKKWPGPHDTLIITESEILDELNPTMSVQARALSSSSSSASASALTSRIASSANTAASSSQYLQVVFVLPDDAAGRQRILKAFHLQADFFGAKVQTCSLLT